ncbi:MAG: HAMP domain-containing histidine kinase [Lentisphaeraceae bacterium]|nr:HAMP domain-containing histidine kinase [Lentisphaeraceae bacterium]
MTNIRLYSELLRKRLDPEDTKAENQLGVVVSESQRLSRLITNVLSFAQQDKNKLKLNMTKIHIDKTVDHVLDHFKPLLATKEISFEVESSAPLPILADVDAIGQILGNLLSNVEKYVQEKGHVSIVSSQDSEWTIVLVSDNGPGIPNSQHKKIFDAFHRLSNKLSDGISGTGIGLSISRDLARMHGGDLTIVESTEGASFKLVLPTKGIQK